MNNLFKILLFLLLLCPLSATAQLSEVSGSEDTYPTPMEDVCSAKPYIHLTFNGTAVYTDAACTTKATNMALRNASTFTYTVEGSDEVNSPSFFVDIDNGKLTYFINDMSYLPAGSTVTITTPVFYSKTDGEDAETTQFSAHTYTFPLSNDIVELSSSCNSSDLDIASLGSKTLVVKAPNVLTVNSNLDVANLIVEAGDESTYAAGVVVENGGSIAIADTAYFLCHKYFHRNNAYLVNHGSYSASASIFTKNVDNNLNKEYSKKYKGSFLLQFANAVNITFPVESPNKVFGFATRPTKSKFQMVLPYGSNELNYRFYLDNAPYLDEYSGVNQYRYVYQQDQTYPIVFRANGTINDEEAYSFSGSSLYDTGNSWNWSRKEPVTQMDNPYQACIDWSALIADESNNAGLADLLRCVNFSYSRVHISCDYNFETGLTTYDGPMQLGYLQPVMEPARFYQLDTTKLDNIMINLSKKYLTSYAEREKVKPNVTVPYVRFYVDDVDDPRGVGNRSIYVAYFIPQEQYDALKEGREDFYGVNLKSEVFFPIELGYNNGNTAGAGYRFPFTGCTLYGDDANLTNRIIAFPLPEKSEYEETEPFSMSLYLDPKQQKVKFGILDYGNMDSIQVQCAGLLLNSIDGEPDVLEAEFDLNSFDENVFSVNKSYKFLIVSPVWKVDPKVMQITRYAQKNSTSDKKVVANELKVSSVSGGIIVTSEEPTDVTVVNVSGVLVNNSAVEGSSFISLPNGLYIVKNNDGSSSKVLVK